MPKPNMYKNVDVSNGSKDITIGHNPADPSSGMRTRAYKGESKGWGEMSVDQRKGCVDKMNATKEVADEKEAVADKKEAARLRKQKSRASKKVNAIAAGVEDEAGAHSEAIVPPTPKKARKAATAPADPPADQATLVPFTPPTRRAARNVSDRSSKLRGKKLTTLKEHRVLESKVSGFQAGLDSLAEACGSAVKQVAEADRQLKQLAEQRAMDNRQFKQRQLEWNQRFEDGIHENVQAIHRQGRAIEEHDSRISNNVEAIAEHGDMLAEMQRNLESAGISPARPRFGGPGLF